MRERCDNNQLYEKAIKTLSDLTLITINEQGLPPSRFWHRDKTSPHSPTDARQSR